MDVIKNCKVTLLGDSGVGKSSLIARYISGIFMRDGVSTTGANYSQKIVELNNTRLRLNLWDTAGEEKYRALGKNFYRDSFIICLIYDITRRQSFQSIKDIWYPDVKKYGEKYNVIALVGNKCDRFEEEEVKEEEACNYAKEIGAEFFLTSARTGDGIDPMFDSLAISYLGPEFAKKLDDMDKGKNKNIKIKGGKDINDKNRGTCC